MFEHSTNKTSELTYVPFETCGVLEWFIQSIYILIVLLGEYKISMDDIKIESIDLKLL